MFLCVGKVKFYFQKCLSLLLFFSRSREQGSSGHVSGRRRSLVRQYQGSWTRSSSLYPGIKLGRFDVQQIVTHIAKRTILQNTFNSLIRIGPFWDYNVGPPKEDIFLDHLLWSIFQFIFTHYNLHYFPRNVAS